MLIQSQLKPNISVFFVGVFEPKPRLYWVSLILGSNCIFSLGTLAQ